MPRFFVDAPPQQTAVLTGEDARHIARSLRMQPGETLVLCDSQGQDFLCEIEEILDNTVRVRVRGVSPSQGEPSLAVTLYQCLPKADKMDSIAQKMVECGAAALVPVLSERCVSRPSPEALSRKCARWQKIAEEAAKQCGRGKIPAISAPLGFAEAIAQAQHQEGKILFYEGGGAPLRPLITPGLRSLAIFIGPEGGFASGEVELARAHGFAVASLGPRIFRAETAPIAALSAILFASGDW